MKYTIHPGDNHHVIFHLHGTGGTAAGLFGLGQMLDEDAILVGIDGEVFEQGMRRYFIRNADGSFDEKSLNENTDQLHALMKEIIEKHQFEDYKLTVLGYSNGANIAQSLLKKHQTQIQNVLLFHPAPTLMDKPYLKQNKMNVFMTGGAEDPFISQDAFKTVKKMLKDADYDVKTFMHPGGHELIHEEIIEAKAFLQKI